MSKLVVVMGCIEGMIPGIDYNAPHAERQRRLEEQRQLFYVALTRVLASGYDSAGSIGDAPLPQWEGRPGCLRR